MSTIDRAAILRPYHMWTEMAAWEGPMAPLPSYRAACDALWCAYLVGVAATYAPAYPASEWPYPASEYPYRDAEWYLSAAQAAEDAAPCPECGRAPDAGHAATCDYTAAP